LDALTDIKHGFCFVHPGKCWDSKGDYISHSILVLDAVYHVHLSRSLCKQRISQLIREWIKIVNLSEHTMQGTNVFHNVSA
jgi:hypothetical protein